MNEQREAESLARWLSQGGELPKDVSPDVLEAALVFRPELAPPPRLSIDEVLAELSSGPLRTEHPDAARLAAWLAEDGVPEDAEDEALEAVFALRPDLAPAPRVSVEDVLAELMDGPLAVGTSTTPEPTLPASLGELPESVVIANNVPGPQRRLPRWFIPGAGALLMAALALLVVLPASEDAPRGFPEIAQSSSASPTAAPAPASIPEAPPAPRGDVAADDWSEKKSPDASSTEIITAGPEGAKGDVAGAGGDGQRAYSTFGAQTAGAVGQDDPTSGLAAESSERGRAGAEPTDALKDLGYLEAKPAAEPAAPPPTTAPVAPTTTATAATATGGATASRGATRDASIAELDEDNDDAGAEMEETLAVSKSPSRKETRATTSKPKAEAAPAAAAPSYDEAPAEPYRFAEVEAAMASGDTARAEALLEVLAHDPDPRTAGEAGLRLGRLYQSQGRKDLALAAVRQALGVSGLPRDLKLKLSALLTELTR